MSEKDYVNGDDMATDVSCSSDDDTVLISSHFGILNISPAITRTLSTIWDVLTALLVALSVVLIWFAIWTLLEEFIPFKVQYLWGTLVIGFVGSFVCIYLEQTSCVLQFINGSFVNFVIAKFLHDFFITLFQIMLWKGWWDLITLFTVSPFACICELVISSLILTSCRSLLVTTQFTIAKESIFDRSAWHSDLIPTGGSSSSVNIMATLAIVHILSITMWTQMWNLTDQFLLPTDAQYYQSTTSSLLIGLVLLTLLFVFDQVKSCLFCCQCFKEYDPHNNCCLFIMYYLMAIVGLFATVQCWRGVWGFAEYYMEKWHKHKDYGSQSSLELSLLLGSMMIIIYTIVFMCGYAQNVAGYTLDFDKIDFDLSYHFLVWANTDNVDDNSSECNTGLQCYTKCMNSPQQKQDNFNSTKTQKTNESPPPLSHLKFKFHPINFHDYDGHINNDSRYQSNFGLSRILMTWQTKESFSTKITLPQNSEEIAAPTVALLDDY